MAPGSNTNLVENNNDTFVYSHSVRVASCKEGIFLQNLRFSLILTIVLLQILYDSQNRYLQVHVPTTPYMGEICPF